MSSRLRSGRGVLAVHRRSARGGVNPSAAMAVLLGVSALASPVLETDKMCVRICRGFAAFSRIVIWRIADVIAGTSKADDKEPEIRRDRGSLPKLRMRADASLLMEQFGQWLNHMQAASASCSIDAEECRTQAANLFEEAFSRSHYRRQRSEHLQKDQRAGPVQLHTGMRVGTRPR